MAIHGMGTDLVEVERLAGALARRGERFLRRVFTPAERALIGAGPMTGQRAAGRFAAKEAVLKALGTGLRAGRWRDVEVGRDPLGRPLVTLVGRLAEVAARRGVAAIHVSITHTRTHAAAVAVAEGAVAVAEGAVAERAAGGGEPPSSGGRRGQPDGSPTVLRARE